MLSVRKVLFPAQYVHLYNACNTADCQHAMRTTLVRSGHYMHMFLTHTATTLSLNLCNIFVSGFSGCRIARKKNFVSDTESLVQKQHCLSDRDGCPHTHTHTFEETWKPRPFSEWCTVYWYVRRRKNSSLSNPKRKLHT
jgi:hypothetical protein